MQHAVGKHQCLSAFGEDWPRRLFCKRLALQLWNSLPCATNRWISCLARGDRPQTVNPWQLCSVCRISDDALPVIGDDQVLHAGALPHTLSYSQQGALIYRLWSAHTCIQMHISPSCVLDCGELLTEPGRTRIAPRFLGTPLHHSQIEIWSRRGVASQSERVSCTSR